MKHYITDLIMAGGTALSLLMASFSAFSQRAQEVQNEVLRLHIPANSNSEEDQRIKLELRDMLLGKYGELLSDSGTLEEAEQAARELLPEIERDCREFLRQKNADYSAHAELVTMYFTTRSYETVTLPAGNYDALRVTLGSGKGENWWCVMFPPLCIPAASKKPTEQEEDILDDFGNPREIKAEFAVYEFIKSLMK